MNIFKNKNGFSMVEVLLACVIISVAALSGLATFNYIGKSNNRSMDICRIHTAGIIEKFQSIGYFAAITDFTPLGSTRTYPGTPSDSLNTIGISDPMLWPTTLDVLGSTGAPTLNNSILITSSINALLGIYNSNPALCLTGGTYTASAPDLFTKPSSELKGASVQIQVIPYDTKTGALDMTCPMPLRIAPEPLYPDTNTNSAFGTSPAKAAKGNNRYNTGLLLKVVESFTNESGLPSSCSIEQKFQYAPDMNPPVAPDYKTINPIPNWGASCTSGGGSYAVTFGYSSIDIEPGAVMVCRDTSVLKGTLAPGHIMASCSGPGAPAPTVVYPKPSYPGSTGFVYNSQYAVNVADTSRQWVPCDRVTACGVAPTSAVLDPSSTPQKPLYKLTYSNLPAYCRVNIEIAALDTSSNSSLNFLTASTSPTNVFYGGSTSLMWDIPMPTCGSTCGSCGTGCGVSAATVYFMCGGCP